jgi:3-deoxy-D-manno-octulosonic-acid transferase
LMLFRPGASLTLGDVTRLLPCSAQDESRFRELGVPAEKIVTTGNIKLDVQIAPLPDAERAIIRRELGMPTGQIVLGSSTWPGEEGALVAALQQARAAGRRCSLLLVPRHAERRGEIERLLRTSELRYHFRSRGPALGEVDVVVADTTGELRKLTHLADVVFIGKSLAPHTEGQTPVEAAALEKPILFGPGMSNFRLIAADLVARGAALEVADGTALMHEVTALLGDDARRAKLAAAAAQWRRENAGAMDRTLAVVREELAKVDVARST